MQRSLFTLFLMASLCGGFAQQTTQLVTRDQPYKLQPSDVLNLEYEYTPEYNQVATVEPGGTVRLKLLG